MTTISEATSPSTVSPVAPAGTRVTESYDVRWIPTWARIVDVPTNRHKELSEGMEHTLARLKAAAESSIVSGPAA